MSSFLLTDLARMTIEQRHTDAVAYSRAKLARRATAKAKAFINRVTNRPRVPKQRRPSSTSTLTPSASSNAMTHVTPR